MGSRRTPGRHGGGPLGPRRTRAGRRGRGASCLRPHRRAGASPRHPGRQPSSSSARRAERRPPRPDRSLLRHGRRKSEARESARTVEGDQHGRYQGSDGSPDDPGVGGCAHGVAGHPAGRASDRQQRSGADDRLRSAILRGSGRRCRSADRSWPPRNRRMGRVVRPFSTSGILRSSCREDIPGLRESFHQIIAR
jgi:hypothetical protein